ncbi:Phosphoglucomutase-3 [Chytriomyces hyalinus]|nr:Phosphoglucomutase-3 [Chytriomyces hyalinus]
MSLQEQVEKWLRLDQDDKTRAEIESLVAANNEKELQRRLGSYIKFGTAGLRAAMEAGFTGMNSLTVIQASQGLASYIESTVPNAKERGVVVGHDHRHNSQSFARLTAAVFLTHGFKVYFYNTLVHTPMVPFAIQHLRLAGGVMVTASHNPKQDNGYKVYWENSAQIIPPHDAGIAERIQSLNNTTTTWDKTLVDTHPNCIQNQTEALKDAYFSAVRNLVSTSREILSATSLRYVYTAMHGVGLPFTQRMLETFGFPAAILVSEQVQPDPEFPTVSFPNPEEKGALSMAQHLADTSVIKTTTSKTAVVSSMSPNSKTTTTTTTTSQQPVGLVLANDPDADRFAAAERKRDGSWHVFTGDQIGTLLGYSLVLKVANRDAAAKKRVALVNSAVSSKMLRSMCNVEGLRYEETLTGFKWMANKVVELRDVEGCDTFFAYEEAIGFMTHEAVLDKDGVTALATFVELAILQHEKGLTMVDLLEELYEKYGFHASDNYYFICYEASTIKAIFEKIRFGGANTDAAIPRSNFRRPDGSVLRYPLTVAGFPVTYIRDLTCGFEMRDIPAFMSKNEGADVVDIQQGEFYPTMPVSASSEMITFELANECVFTLRTSGTEPKIKYYIEKKGTDRSTVSEHLKAVVKAVGDELFEAAKNNLK